MKQHIERIIQLGWTSSDHFNVIDSGWSNIVVEVNQQQIFRFPRQITPQFEVEKTFLKMFAPISSIPVPELEESPTDFMTYKRLKGERFAPEKFWPLSTLKQEAVIRQLADFLTALHTVEFNHPNFAEFPYGGSDFWQDLWPYVADNLSTKARLNAQNYFYKILDQIEQTPFRRSIVHADLGTNNTLVDFNSATITGIIDFSDMCWGDPAADFASYFKHFGKDFTQKLINTYQRPVESNFWPRIEFQSKRKLFFIAFFAQNYGFQEHLPWVINQIEEQFTD